MLQKLVQEQINALTGLWKNKRKLSFHALNLAMIVFSALMMWKLLIVGTKSESPVVVVLSGSMEPAFQRGDILFLNNDDAPIRVGEIVVFKIKEREIPIVHRVLKVHENNEGKVTVLTKVRPEPEGDIRACRRRKPPAARARRRHAELAPAPAPAPTLPRPFPLP
jgi:signal peptidase